MQWFIKEQVEEVASMSGLLTVVERSRENPMLAEEWLVRERTGGESEDPTAPASPAARCSAPQPGSPGSRPSTQRRSPPSTSSFQIGARVLDRVDDLARALERRAAMRRARRDDHARLAQRHDADAVLGRRGAEPVALDRGAHDLAHRRLGHLGVGLVLELLDGARDAAEGHDGAGPRIAHARRRAPPATAARRAHGRERPPRRQRRAARDRAVSARARRRPRAPGRRRRTRG